MRILITGGSSDIAKAIAKRFSQMDHEIFYTVSSADKVAEVQEKYQGIEAKALVHKLDSTGNFQPAMATEIETGFDALILNAASRVKRLHYFHETAREDFVSSLGQDVLGNVHLLQAVLPGMMNRKFGRLVFISSMTVPMGSTGYGLYSLTKGAIESLFINLAVDYGSYNILANIIRPGTIRTERTRRFWKREKYVEKVNAFIPQGSMGTPEQIAEALDPLLSANCYINGAIIPVSGGLPMVRTT